MLKINYENFNAHVSNGVFKFFISYVDIINIIKENNKKFDINKISTTCFEYNIALSNYRSLNLFNEYFLYFMDEFYIHKSINVDGIYEINKEDIDEAFSEYSSDELLKSLTCFSKLMLSLSERLSYQNSVISNPNLVFSHESISYSQYGVSVNFDSKFVEYLENSFIENFENFNNSVNIDFINKYLNYPSYDDYFNKIIPAALKIRSSKDFINFVEEFCINFKIID
jgi:hypothetical protein